LNTETFLRTKLTLTLRWKPFHTFSVPNNDWLFKNSL